MVWCKGIEEEINKTSNKLLNCTSLVVAVGPAAAGKCKKNYSCFHGQIKWAKLKLFSAYPISQYGQYKDIEQTSSLVWYQQQTKLWTYLQHVDDLVNSLDKYLCVSHKSATCDFVLHVKLLIFNNHRKHCKNQLTMLTTQ